jgi:hypothetical protein
MGFAAIEDLDNFDSRKQKTIPPVSTTSSIRQMQAADGCTVGRESASTSLFVIPGVAPDSA